MFRESGEEDLGTAGYTAAPTQLALCLRLALLKVESWLCAATLLIRIEQFGIYIIRAGYALQPSMTQIPQLQSYTIQVWLYETFIVSMSSPSG
jgi:hypothetical protein